MKKVFFVFPLLAMMFLVSCGPNWEPLFNGKDFTGWEAYIGVPDSSVDVPGMERNEEGVYTQPLGLGNDPLKVFTVVEVDGGPAIRASGQIYGSFATVNEYGNYHLRLEVRWGEKKWAPREDKPRNAGVLYHGTGDFGAGLGVWKMSHECQVMETMFGDSFRMGETFCDITASRTNENERYTFDRTAPKVSFGNGLPAGPICSKNPMNEKPTGEWNTIEVLCYEGASVHVINGKVNMINTNSHVMVNNKDVPLTRGVIQLQSEGAEIYYRNIEIRSISKIPEEYLK
ncbi:MAG: DUF1080 domain-containing protein [Bacteroidales bacterium]|jgi:hypothetical protein|nr:DUF1080 domain-containing protein [Bacteroidales bacterium]